MISYTVILLLVPGIFLGAYGSILLKKGAKDFTINLFDFKSNLFAYLGIFLFGLSSILYVLALQFEKLSVLYPLSSVSYVLIAILSKKYLNEKMNNIKWMGIVFIIFGSFLVVN